MGTDGIREKYINPYTDLGFKKLFGTAMNKELLISFLNALLYDREVICDVTYLNTEHLGTQEYDRRAIFDVYCVNEKGERFLVEMQKGEQNFFKDRSVYYSTFPIREQAPRGQWDYELKAVYVVGILNFVFDDTDDDYFHHEVKLTDLRTREVFYDKLSFFYLEMPKFNKTENELVTMFDKWLFVLRNLAYLMERPRALQERVFTSLFEAAEIAKFSRRELCQYEESLKNFRDMYSVITTAEGKGLARGLEEGLKKGLKKGLEEGLKKGLKEGLAKGREEGLQKAREQMMVSARNLKSLGVAKEIIVQATGLSPDEIERL